MNLRPFRENLAYKLLALILSIGLWTYVQLHQEPSTLPVQLRLELRGLPDSLVATPATSQVTVIVDCPKIYASRVTPENVTAYVDAHDLAPGTHRVEVKTGTTAALRSVLTVRTRTPDHVEVRVRPRVRRSVPVTVEWRGAVPLGMRYGVPRLDPDTVQISGADNAVALVDHAVVQLTAGNPHVSDRYPALPVDNQGSLVREISVNPDTVSVDVTLVKTLERQQVYVLPAWNGQLAPGYSVQWIRTEPQTVLLVGPAERIRGLTTVPTQPVDVAGLMGDIVRTVAVITPPGVSALPRTVQARVRVVKTMPLKGR